MRLYLFWSGRDSGVFGLTSDASGKNLPADLAPWQPNGDERPMVAWPDDGCTSGIRFQVLRDGFYLMRSDRLAKLASTIAGGSPPAIATA